MDHSAAINEELAALRAENARLKEQLAATEREKKDQHVVLEGANPPPATAAAVPLVVSSQQQRLFGPAQLTKQQIERYSRQMLLPDLGPFGTKALLKAKVLVVGAGGLGATVIPYLAAAGVGHITIVDFDTVEESNLHRQIIHNEARIGMQKALSAKAMAEALNSKDCTVTAVCEPFSVENAQSLCRSVDVVVDASDNVACRYLVNDASVLEGKPLVSGCATRWEGQLTVYNCPFGAAGPPPPPPANMLARLEAAGTPYVAPTRGPCYRCLFPTPTPASAVGSCNEVGVVGPIPGTIGCLQALEAIKVIVFLAAAKRKKEEEKSAISAAAGAGGAAAPSNTNTNNCNNIDLLVGRMYLFDGLRSAHKVVRIRGQQPNCAVCSAQQRAAKGLAPMVGDAHNTNSGSADSDSNGDAANQQRWRSNNPLKEAHYGPLRLFPEYTTGVACELPDSSPRVDLVESTIVMGEEEEVGGVEGEGEGGEVISNEGRGAAIARTALRLAASTLSDRTGVRCREATVAELDAFIQQRQQRQQTNGDGIGKNKKKVIVVDVRPATQQALFGLVGNTPPPTAAARGDAVSGRTSSSGPATATATPSDASAASNTAVIEYIQINADTMERDLEAHVDAILEAAANNGIDARHKNKKLLQKHANAKRDRDVEGKAEEEDGHGNEEEEEACETTIPIHFICRRGNKSRKAIYSIAPLLQERLAKYEAAEDTFSTDAPPQTTAISSSGAAASIIPSLELVNVVGGLTYWARDVDRGFPSI